VSVLSRAQGWRKQADAGLGKRLEKILISHHRRRLKRLGRLDALDAPPGGWAESDPPPRESNALDVLVDGSDALPAIAEAVSGARSQVWLAGWHFSPELRMGEGGPTVRELLAEAAGRIEVRVLAWAGAPLPLFHPSRKEVREGRDKLVRGTKIIHALDAQERPMHCHHEKLVIVDGELAFVGGIDLSLLGGNRLDTSRHPARGTVGWHDAAARLRGPAVADVANHFALRWGDVTGEELPPTAEPARAGELEVQLVRTVPEHVYEDLHDGDFSILESYVRALRSAERFVYLESQFLWSPELVTVLADKLRDPPHDDFRLVVLLPSHAKNGQEDTRGQLGVLAEADTESGGGRLLASTLRQPGPDTKQVYVHAKIAIVDDRWLTIGSANLNEHSLFNDTEVNLVCHDEGLARAVRLRLWSEHLGCEPSELEGDPCRIIDERWRPEAGVDSGRLRLLPHVSHRSKGVLGPINGFLVDG
jgi:phosphatidylserine/phosphatidylglycerophosphate/cardiolipin synthase-like enzyme